MQRLRSPGTHNGFLGEFPPYWLLVNRTRSGPVAWLKSREPVSFSDNGKRAGSIQNLRRCARCALAVVESSYSLAGNFRCRRELDDDEPDGRDGIGSCFQGFQRGGIVGASDRGDGERDDMRFRSALAVIGELFSSA
jgi:hypothetical protein